MQCQYKPTQTMVPQLKALALQDAQTEAVEPPSLSDDVRGDAVAVGPVRRHIAEHTNSVKMTSDAEQDPCSFACAIRLSTGSSTRVRLHGHERLSLLPVHVVSPVVERSRQQGALDTAMHGMNVSTWCTNHIHTRDANSAQGVPSTSCQ